MCKKLILGRSSLFQRRRCSSATISPDPATCCDSHNARLAEALKQAGVQVPLGAHTETESCQHLVLHPGRPLSTVFVVMQDARLVHTQHEPMPAAADIKTMVLMQQELGDPVQPVAAPGTVATGATQALAVLLLAGHKVDLRAVAQHLQVPRGTLRLATAEEAEGLTGYQLGCIPPLGKPACRWPDACNCNWVACGCLCSCPDLALQP